MAPRQHTTHLAERGTITELDGTPQPAPAPRFSRTTPPHPHPHQNPAHTDEVLADWEN